MHEISYKITNSLYNMLYIVNRELIQKKTEFILPISPIQCSTCTNILLICYFPNYHSYTQPAWVMFHNCVYLIPPTTVIAVIRYLQFFLEYPHTHLALFNAFPNLSFKSVFHTFKNITNIYSFEWTLSETWHFEFRCFKVISLFKFCSMSWKIFFCCLFPRLPDD